MQQKLVCPLYMYNVQLATWIALGRVIDGIITSKTQEWFRAKNPKNKR